MLPAFLIPLLINMGAGAALGGITAAINGGGNPSEIESHKQDLIARLMMSGMSEGAAAAIADQAAEGGGSSDILPAMASGAVGGALTYGAFKGAGAIGNKVASFIKSPAAAKTVNAAVDQTVPRLSYEPRTTNFSMPEAVNPIRRGINPKIRVPGTSQPTKSFDGFGGNLPAPQQAPRLGYDQSIPMGYQPSLAPEPATAISPGMSTIARGAYANAQGGAAADKMRQMSAMQQLRRNQFEAQDAEKIADAIMAGAL